MSGETHVKKKRKKKQSKKKRKQQLTTCFQQQQRKPKRPKLQPQNVANQDNHVSKSHDVNSPLSLGSRLKRHRGTAESTPLPPPWSQQEHYNANPSNDSIFLTPQHEVFASCQEECYRGFVWEHPSRLAPKFHDDFDAALDALYQGGLFLYDAIQAGGKKVSHTKVTRTLIGNPGSTYRYLGLRLFSHPWTSSQGEELSPLTQMGYAPSVARALLTLGQLNQTLTCRTQQALKTHIQPHVQEGLVGSASYTLSLVNRMEPIQHDWKPMDKTSVSWHKDSGLMDFSAIAVYHSLRGQHGQTTTTKSSSSDEDMVGSHSTPWRVALRVADKDCPTPPLAIPLPSGSVYYLLDDFNHKHEHAVLSGEDAVRYSSTHRVAREGRGTWHYIRDKCRQVLGQAFHHDNDTSLSSKQSKLQLVKTTRALQLLLTEIEFEWLRQWHVQGPLHASLHYYWHEPMQQLSEWFHQVEVKSLDILRLLQQEEEPRKKSKKKKKASDHFDGTPSSQEDLNNYLSKNLLSEDLYDVMIESLEERIRLDKTWKQRLEDPFYKSLPAEMQPFGCPALTRYVDELQDLIGGDKKMSKQVDVSKYHLNKALLGQIRKWRAIHVHRKTQDSVPSKSIKNSTTTKDSKGGLTKKEKRKIASNWEVLKSSLVNQKGKKRKS